MQYYPNANRETERVQESWQDICRDVLCLGGYTLEQPQAVKILGILEMVGIVGMVGIDRISL